MQYFDASNYPVEVRADIPVAFSTVWEITAAPGNWWNAKERVAIAQEVRNASNCTLCSERNAALSPNAEAHTHPASNNLSASAIEAVHRITRDAQRLSEQWLSSITTEGISDAHYVELLGIVVAVISIDTFHHALDTPLETLPKPNPGQPTGCRPPGAKKQGAWVATVMPNDLSQSEANMHGGAVVLGNRARIAAARTAVTRDLGVAAMVDAAAVIANFQRMVRIADSTGIPLDEPVMMMTQGIRQDLGLNTFAAAEDSPDLPWLKRVVGKILAPPAPRILQRMARKRSAQA